MEEPCRFFARGNCAFGTACRFAHPAPARAAGRSGGAQASKPSTAPTRTAPRAEAGRQICRFFANGHCQFGDACRNLHQREETAAEALLREHVEAEQGYEDPGIPPYQAGWGDADDSLFSHGPMGGPMGGPMLSAFPPMPQAPPASSQHGARDSRDSRDSRERGCPEGDDTECGICFDTIKRKGERYGMLENCDHAFCLTCIRAWRKEREQQDRNNLRLCPVCRTESFFVVPADDIIMDPEVKRRAIEDYQKQMSKLPCKLFNYGKGSCPFGTSCFYAHLNPDGTRFVPAPLRRMAGAGGTHVRNEVKISDFFS